MTCAEMQAFMEYVYEALALDNDSIVYRVGDTAFAYEDNSTGELVIWDRATEIRQTIAVGDKIQTAVKNWHIMFTEDKNYQSACFQVNTAEGTYYIGYDEKNPAKTWSEYSTTPFEKEEELDAYYVLLRNTQK